MLPASIMSAYWTIGFDLELDFEHFVVPYEESEGVWPFALPISVSPPPRIVRVETQAHSNGIACIPDEGTPVGDR